MARRTRHATASQGDDSYASIVNKGYLSEYFLAYRLRDGLSDLYRRWDDREKAGEPTARAGLRGLGTSFSRLRTDAAATGLDRTAPDDIWVDENAEDHPIELASLSRDAVDAQRSLNSDVLAALRWDPVATEISLMVGETAITVPVAAQRDTASGVLLVAIETVFSTEPASVVASKTSAHGTLLSPVTSGDKVVARTALEAAQLIFTADQPPTYVLVVSGGAITLLDRERWGEGVFIGVNLDDAIARGDDRAKGELASIAALFSADTIDPGDDAQSVLSALLDRSTNESAGVSKELRHGMRRSVELLAAAVVDDIRTRQKKAWQDIDADDMTRQCLRYLYRIIVLLFAEARPELGILPVNDTDYQAGYSVARLRDVALVDIHSAASTNSTHIQQSLDVLFALVNDGFRPEDQLDDGRSIVFPGLKSALFGADACPMLDRAEIPDPVLQQVLANLCFTREQSGRQRQSLSYATLGINQLGAVYEGLMAYRGFLATEELFEVDNDGDPDNGTWVIPVSKADDFDDTVFVSEPGPDGTPRRVRYGVGDFVFRLAGRDRQRSASFYTPEVLTEFTVRHALDVYEEEHPAMTAADWLAITVCEPALGSGAFANEAVNQLAARYLKAAQRERGETIDPDRFQFELQKAKAHFAINRAYGVDLNGTAVELAEVSAWLNVMHDGLAAPRFDARLRRGNSLIGARRATYTTAQVAKAPWKGTSKNPVVPPADQPISEKPLGSEIGIHHFLLPGEGWGCAADAVELKGKGGKNPQPGLVEDWSEHVREWRKTIQGAPSKQQVDRLAALSRRVEKAWEQSAKDVANHLAAHERRVDVWGAPEGALPPEKNSAGSADFLRPDGPTARLRMLMDAWCALWMWAPANGTGLPSFTTWLDAAELLLGQPTQEESGALFSAYELQDGSLESVDYFGKATIAEILERYPWLSECRAIADRQAFFHWELEFAPVFQRGGFDLQVGNPPWVRPDWIEPDSLAEFDPWWTLTNLKSVDPHERVVRRASTLAQPLARETLIAERSENAGLTTMLSAGSREPLLVGLRTNLYMVFMPNSWRRAHPQGVVGLVHPETHFVAASGDLLRSSCFARLRRHWQFSNGLLLFTEVHNLMEYGVHIYGSAGDVAFQQAVNLMSPSTLDRSIDHDGTGETPGVQFPEGGWDLRPHRQRIVAIKDPDLRDWARLTGLTDTSHLGTRLLRPPTQVSANLIRLFSSLPRTMSEKRAYLTVGFDEGKLKSDGTAIWKTHRPESMNHCVLQGPHIRNATPFAREPRENCKSNKDWESLDLERLPLDFIPRSNYKFAVRGEEIENRVAKWGKVPYSDGFRLGFREWVDPAGVRTMQAFVVPPATTTLGTIMNVGFSTRTEMVTTAGLFSSLPYDFVVRVGGIEHLNQFVVDAIRMPDLSSELSSAIALRVLRLNCLTRPYAGLWNELFEGIWLEDRLMSGLGTVGLGEVRELWDSDTPLRREQDRWLACCDLDALAALALGIDDFDLLQMYRSQFDVLRQYEHTTVFDGNGRQISGIHHNYGFHQADWEANYKWQKVARGEQRMGMWDRVQAHMAGDTSVDLGPFVPPFTPADREAAMSKAYRAFAERLASE